MLQLLEQTADQLHDWFVQCGLPTYRARQVRKWLFQKRAAVFEEMTDLPAALRQRLAAEFQIWSTRVARHRKAADGTEKLLLELHDGQQIECVLLRDDKQHCTVCISTQVGCAMGCTFCATGLDGAVRNLTAGEILEQMLQLQRLLGGCEKMGTGSAGEKGVRTIFPRQDAQEAPLRTKTVLTPFSEPSERLSHVVVMGMGEPLLNLDALRNELVPANRGFGVAAIMAAADEYFELTGRRVTFEYVLLAGINDQSEHARQLIALLRGRPALVNLIPYNPVPGLPYRTPSPAVTARFVEILTQGGLNVNIRYRKGERIDAACGQLRRERRRRDKEGFP